MRVLLVPGGMVAGTPLSKESEALLGLTPELERASPPAPRTAATLSAALAREAFRVAMARDSGSSAPRTAATLREQMEDLLAAPCAGAPAILQ